MSGEATTPEHDVAAAAALDGDGDVEGDGLDLDFDRRLGRLHDALRSVARCWGLALWSFTGVGSPDGVWIMPVLYVAPPLLGRALWRLAALAPQTSQRLLRACTVLLGPGWAFGLWGSSHGGPFSLGQRLGQACGTAGLAVFCGALWSWCRAAGIARATPGWAKATRQGAIALGLVAAIAAVDALGTGSLVSVGPPKDVSGVVIGLVAALVIVVIGTLISANLAMKATRASLTDLRRSLQADGAGAGTGPEAT